MAGEVPRTVTLPGHGVRAAGRRYRTPGRPLLSVMGAFLFPVTGCLSDRSSDTMTGSRILRLLPAMFASGCGLQPCLPAAAVPFPTHSDPGARAFAGACRGFRASC